MGNRFRSAAAAVTAAALAAGLAAAAPAVALPQLGGVTAPVTGLTGGAGLLPALPTRESLPSAGMSLPSAGTAAGVPMAHIKSRVALRPFEGVVLSVDRAAGRLVVAARRGRRGSWPPRVTREFLVAGARMRIRDRNGDGEGNLADIGRGDRVRLKALAGDTAASAREPLEARVLTS